MLQQITMFLSNVYTECVSLIGSPAKDILIAQLTVEEKNNWFDLPEGHDWEKSHLTQFCRETGNLSMRLQIQSDFTSKPEEFRIIYFSTLLEQYRIRKKQQQQHPTHANSKVYGALLTSS